MVGDAVEIRGVLRHVGILTQTISLTATAMGLGACALGAPDTAAFAAATGLDELEECGVGSMILGSVLSS
ncbi:nitroreductase family protein [Nocardia beijingensis]|uniref:nitroreductase family protein n=1 Tax=Nocardia beijingensis TaxID=95162 RepID=UPI002B4B0EBB|nr:nitroreductase family protein [Nocardia beijingensis]